MALTTAALTTLSAPASRGADSTEIVAYNAVGDRVAVGTVMAQGIRDGAGCVIAGPITLRVLTPGSSVRMSTRDDCSVVITHMGKAERDITRSHPGGVPWVDPSGVGSDRSGRSVAGFVADHAVAPQNKTGLLEGIVWQEALAPGNSVQALAQFKVQYVRDASTGELRDVQPFWPDCSANPDALYLIHTRAVATTEVRSCRQSVPSYGPDAVDLVGSGVFRHSMLGTELVTFRLDGRFMAYAGNYYESIYTCVVEVVSGRWPNGWSTECNGDEIRGGVE